MSGVREATTELIGYLQRNAHRMEYPEYVARGWCIGSGAVKCACKTVVGQRLKLAGMRWGEDGSHAVCHPAPSIAVKKDNGKPSERDFSRN